MPPLWVVGLLAGLGGAAVLPVLPGKSPPGMPPMAAAGAPPPMPPHGMMRPPMAGPGMMNGWGGGFANMMA